MTQAQTIAQMKADMDEMRELIRAFVSPVAEPVKRGPGRPKGSGKAKAAETSGTVYESRYWSPTSCVKFNVVRKAGETFTYKERTYRVDSVHGDGVFATRQ
jgi:hypothetical protein